MGCKRIITFLFITTLFFMLIMFAVKAEPHYEVSIDLFDTSVSEGDNFNFTVFVLGGDTCEDSTLIIHAESALQLLDVSNVQYNVGTNGWELFNIDPKASVSCNNNGDLVSYRNNNINQSGVMLIFNLSNTDVLKNNLSHMLKVTLNTNTLENANGGDYKIKGHFLCKNNNSWYIFSGENQYHVLSWYEKLQIFFESFSLVIAIIGGIIVVLFGKEVKDFLRDDIKERLGQYQVTKETNTILNLIYILYLNIILIIQIIFKIIWTIFSSLSLILWKIISTIWKSSINKMRKTIDNLKEKSEDKKDIK